MKTIKVDFIGFWSNFNKTDNLFYNILKEKYVVEIGEDPDFVFVSPLCKPFEYLKYDCVRILFTGEPLSPDFNVFDYAIGFDNLSCLDAEGLNRYYRFPLCVYGYERTEKFAAGISYDEAKKILENKKYFCNFMYGHKSAKGERELILSTVEKYKRVESAGSFLNNMPDGKVVPYSDKKIDFLRMCKFTIACESISHPGFVTEKLTDPFVAYSIPIYFGNPLVGKEFNTKAFVNCHEYDSFDEALNKVIEIDNNDELYIEMLMQNKFVSEDYYDNLCAGLKSFLWQICSRKPQEAYRRMRFYIAKDHESYLNEYRKFSNSIWYKIFKKLN